MAVVFNDEQMQEIERLALLNCNSNTIAEAVGVAVNTLKRHCGRKLKHWWATYRVNLRESQDKHRETSPDMAKFLGKNVLGQVDKIETVNKTEIVTIPKIEQEATDEACKVYKLKLAGKA